ncbi:Gfo/Idh/MocA family protein [Alkalihalobacillus trypoxylicola]|uniref:Oxidoreductase n=1 Tax=Alkalihalobacillus trypoxylicola TaxID=519424 RepID=A0A162EZJ8_9BACI|nr:Gfo/Idh/MocA family oxidoreductase [Alkalihalobacillus trypoxylicola]KYG34114.1 oxidoreductase [Alkalihalobacillus trypoxylicola]
MIKVAIIGVGAISKAHIDAYLSFQERCEIVALCDIYPEKAQRAAEKFTNHLSIYSDYKQMINEEEIDLVSVCTPPYTHADITIDVLESGVNVLVEKPMASSLEECDAMNEAARRNKKVLSVVAQNRFMTPIKKLKSVLNSGLAGEIVHIQIDSHWWRGYSYYDLWWRGTWEKEGGGCTLNHAVHHIDMLQWMVGMPKEITAVATNTAHDNAEVEDLSIAICKYENNCLAQITSSVVHHGEEQTLIFQGRNARISVPWKVTASQSMENGFPLNDPIVESELQKLYNQYPSQKHEGHSGQIEDILLALEGKKEVLVDGIQGKRTLELIMAIYQAASLKQTVKLPLTKNDPFYTRAGVLENATYFYEKKKHISNFNSEDITIGGNYK